LVRAGIVSSFDESSQGESAITGHVGLGIRKLTIAKRRKSLASHRNQKFIGRQVSERRLGGAAALKLARRQHRLHLARQGCKPSLTLVFIGRTTKWYLGILLFTSRYRFRGKFPGGDFTL
jgi:hypothetical protein